MRYSFKTCNLDYIESGNSIMIDGALGVPGRLQMLQDNISSGGESGVPTGRYQYHRLPSPSFILPSCHFR